MFERFDGTTLLRFGAAGTDKNAGVAHVGSDADLVDDDGNLKTRVLEFAGKHGVDFVGDFFADAFVTVIGSSHGGQHSINIS